MNKLYTVGLVIISLSIGSSNAMMHFLDGNGIKKRPSLLISSPRTIEQNAREQAAQENLSGSEDSGQATSSKESSGDLADAASHLGRSHENMNNTFMTGSVTPDYDSLLSAAKLIAVRASSDDLGAFRTITKEDALDTLFESFTNPRITSQEMACKVGTNLLLLQYAPLSNITILNAPSDLVLTKAVKRLICENLTSAIDAVSFKDGQFTIDFNKTYYMPTKAHEDSSDEDTVSSVEDVAEKMPTSMFLDTLHAIKQIQEEGKESEELIATKLLLLLEQAPADHIVIKNPPMAIDPEQICNKLTSILDDLNFTLDALSIEGDTLVIDCDTERPQLTRENNAIKNDVVTQEINAQEVVNRDHEDDNENSDDTTESTTEEQQVTSPDKVSKDEQHLSLLNKLKNADINNKVTITGFIPRQADHIERIKPDIIKSITSVADAVTESSSGFTIDLSRIVSFPLDATQEEINLSQLLTLQDEEVVLFDGNNKIAATTKEKQAARLSVVKGLQAIVRDANGQLGIDTTKLASSAYVAPQAKQEQSLIQKLGIPALKYGSCVGLAYLALKLTSAK